MKPINVLVFPYRDQYFLKRYGNVVRDLQIIEALTNISMVNQVCVVNRPVSLHERILGKRRLVNNCPALSQCRFWDATSRDIVGPLFGRAWTENCYRKYLTDIQKWTKFSENALNILLDFTPLARFNYGQFPGYVVWYDVIDNFTRHNRYSKRERMLVRQKYRQVKECARLVTGVTSEALSAVGMNDSMVVHNGLTRPVTTPLDGGPTEFDIGFIGFVTNKFDLDLIDLLSEAGFRTAIFGEIYDRKVKKALARMKGVAIMGQFNGEQLPAVMESFSIGVIPYRKDRSHDESPIKLYQFLAYGKPVITSQRYPGETDDKEAFVLVTEGRPKREIIEMAQAFLDRLHRERTSFAEEIRKSIEEDMFWTSKVQNILEKLQGMSA